MRMKTINDAKVWWIVGGGSISRFTSWGIGSCRSLTLLILSLIWSCVSELGTYIFPDLINSPLMAYIIAYILTMSGKLGFISTAKKVRWKWKVKRRWK